MNRTFITMMALIALPWSIVADAQPVPSVDHYLCYRARPLGPRSTFPAFTPRSGDVIVDQLGVGQQKLDLLRPLALCAPADKNGEDPTAPTHPGHLEAYDAAPTRTDPRQPRAADSVHEVRNQLGTLRLVVRGVDRVLVPSSKALGTAGVPPDPTPSNALDHFKCYVAKVAHAPRSMPAFPTFAPAQVTVQDQFGTRVLDLKRPTRLCNPADKNGEDPTAPTHPGHLVCYQARLARTIPRQSRFVSTDVSTNNQFGREVLTLGRADELCVPSILDPATATATPTPGPSPTPGILVAVQVNPASRTVNPGGNANYTATGEYLGGATKNLTQQVVWASSDPNVALASNPDGNRSRIDAVHPGIATISATDPVTGITSTASNSDATFNVPGPLLRIELSPDAPGRAVGEFVNFTATGFFEGGVTKNLTQQLLYSSSDPNVALATNLDGSRSRVDAVGPGTATIAATDPVTGVSTTDSGDDSTLKVLGALQRLTLTPVNKTRPANQVQNYTATGYYAGGATQVVTQDVVYSSSDPTVAVATNLAGSKSRVETLQPGTVTISATDPTTGLSTTDSGDDATLVVTPPLDSLQRITLSPVAATRTAGQTQNYTATGIYASGAAQNITQQVVYASNAPSVAAATNTPGNKSLVDVLAPGTAIISATDPTSGVSTTDTGDDATLTVLGALERITLSPVSATRAANTILHYTATGHYGGGTTQNITQQVLYASNDATVAVATNEPGDQSKVEALTPGTAVISASDPATGISTTTSGDDATLTVTGALESITVTPVTSTLTIGQSETYTAVGHFGGGTTKNLTQQVVYASSDPNVAVAPNIAGNRSRVDAVGAGSASISATQASTGISSTDTGDDATLTVVP